MIDDVISRTARQKLGRPAEWIYKSSRMIGTGPDRVYLVTGGIPRALTRGPRKGQRVFDGVALDEVVITPTEIANVLGLTTHREDAKVSA